MRLERSRPPGIQMLLSDAPRVSLTGRALDDYELLTTGALAPLDTFMGADDYRSCIRDLRLADGALFPIPITLPSRVPFDPGTTVALTHPRGDVLAALSVQESFEVDPQRESEALFTRADPSLGYVRELFDSPKWRLSGEITPLRPVEHADFKELRHTPREVRDLLKGLGRRNVVAFQTRNPLHRSHEEMLRRAALQHDATVLLHPAEGLTRAGDVDHFTRVRTYQALVAEHWEPGTILLSLLPLAMRMAGPREALLHAIIRRNYGATHFIVGRDHAGPGMDSNGVPYFDPMAAQQTVLAHADEIGIKVVAFEEMVYVEDQDRYEERSRVDPASTIRTLSGTEVRRRLSDGVPLPTWFTRPSTASILAEAFPARERQGFCIWLTGLSGAGKSAVAEILRARLLERGRPVTLLDGDEVRQHLSKGLGFSKDDRDTNILRIGYVASEIVRHHGAVICAAISPYRGPRDQCRAMMRGRFAEVFVDTSLEVCESRDSKGLYAKARSGEIKGFTGIDDPYETPLSPEVHLGDPGAGVDANADRVWEWLVREGLIRER